MNNSVRPKFRLRAVERPAVERGGFPQRWNLSLFKDSPFCGNAVIRRFGTFEDHDPVHLIILLRNQTEAYDAASVERGARLYRDNCALCHGAEGRGIGPAAAAPAVRPADLTAPHLLAHPEGDLFWWVSHGKGDGAMPGFASVIDASGRWDVVNFVRARVAGMISRSINSQVLHGTAPPVPDFAFESDRRQQTLHRLLQEGPVLLVLFSNPPPAGRIAELAAMLRRFAASGLHVVALEFRSDTTKAEHAALIDETDDVGRSALALFRASDDGGETDLLLDRAAEVRARWTESGAVGVVTDGSLPDDIDRIKGISAGSETHAGHAM